MNKVLWNKNNPDLFIINYKKFSSNFIKIISDQIDSISNRKLAEIFDIDNIEEIKKIREELLRLNK